MHDFHQIPSQFPDTYVHEKIFSNFNQCGFILEWIDVEKTAIIRISFHTSSNHDKSRITPVIFSNKVISMAVEPAYEKLILLYYLQIRISEYRNLALPQGPASGACLLLPDPQLTERKTQRLVPAHSILCFLKFRLLWSGHVHGIARFRFKKEFTYASS